MLNPDSLEKPETPRMPVVDRNLIEKYSQSSQEIGTYFNCKHPKIIIIHFHNFFVYVLQKTVDQNQLLFLIQLFQYQLLI